MNSLWSYMQLSNYIIFDRLFYAEQTKKIQLKQVSWDKIRNASDVMQMLTLEDTLVMYVIY